jgi:hypothetical protein
MLPLPMWRKSFHVNELELEVCIVHYYGLNFLPSLVDKHMPGEKVVNAHTGKCKPEHGPKTKSSRSVQPAMAKEPTSKVKKHGVHIHCPVKLWPFTHEFTRIEATSTAPITMVMMTPIRRLRVCCLKS